jgi:hypothetical protein
MNMKNRITLLILFSLLAFSAGIRAQDTRWDTIPDLIISEIRLATYEYTYIELTNVDDVAINLKDFKIATSYYYSGAVNQGPTGYAYLPDKVLQPGESFLVASVHDFGDLNYSENLYLGSPNGWMMRTMPEVLEYVDLPVFSQETSSLDPRDSVSAESLRGTTQKPFLNLHDCGKNVILEYHKGNDSVFVDLFFATATGDASTFTYMDGLNNEALAAVAGIPRVVGAFYMGASGQWPGAPEYTVVRKTSVQHGSVSWDDQRGTDADNSEWIVIPAAHNYRLSLWEWSKYFTTLGRHGNGSISETTVTSDVVTIDWVNHKMSVPWGIRRFNLMDYITVGDNISWEFIQSTNPADATHIGVRTGDKLVMYATGETRQEVDFDIEVVDAIDQTKALILPLLAPVGTSQTLTRIYEVTYDIPGMDTIYGMDFGLRVDSLYKYLEKAEGATWKLICVDGLPDRADLKRGDLLRVTNGAVTKDYYLAVSAIPVVNNNPYLQFIKWPDVPSVLRTNNVWKNNDIIPNFFNVVKDYIIKLPSGTKDVPALTVIPQNVNASVTIESASTLNGLPEDRTTRITVVSEDGLNTVVYTVRFDVETSASNIQPVVAEPIFTRFVPALGINDNMMAIGNPGTTNIDLSNYVVSNALGGTAPDQVLPRALSAYGFRYFAYVPGYDYGTEAEWNANPGIIHPDYQVNPIIPPGRCFVMVDRVDGFWWYLYSLGGTVNRSDMMLNPYIDVAFVNINQKTPIDQDPEKYYKQGCTFIRAGWDWYGAVSQTRDLQFQSLYKIVGDSVKEGLKAVGSDLTDYQLIDMMGTYDNTNWEPITGLGPGRPVPNEVWAPGWGFLPWSIERKPNISKGNPLPGGSWGTAETSEWTMLNYLDFNPNQSVIGFWQAAWQIGLGIDYHLFDPVTDNSSTVLSHAYKVSGGYTSPQTITGVITGTTVADFMVKIIKRNPDQTLEVLHKGSTDAVVSADTLKVTSKDATNVTNYILTVSDVGLSDDAVLVAKTGSGLTVEVSGDDGTVSGIKFGTTLESLLASLVKPANSTLRVINASGNLVPMKYSTAEGSNMTVKTSENISLEVTSENSENTITYELAIAEFTDNAAYLTSNIYNVDQEVQLVSLIPSGVRVPVLLSNLQVNKGATVIVVDKVGSERTAGNVAIDDNILVTSPDGTVTKIYWLSFMGQRQGALAYVTSDVLVVDQEQLTISGIPKNTSLNIFLGLVRPAPFATLNVFNAEGTLVTSGNIGEGFTLQVTSGDNTKTVAYNLSVLVNIPNTEIELVRIYPNPATDQITIEGLRENCTITITSILGNKVKVLDSKNIHNATISVEDLPAGIYLITITAENYKSQPVRLLVQ